MLFLSILSCGGGGSGDGGGNEEASITGTVLAGEGVASIRLAPKTNFLASLALVKEAYAQDVGVPLQDATVELLLNGVVVDTTVTDENGDFTFYNVGAGDYSIRVTHPSIQPVEVTGVAVLAGDLTIISGTVTADGATAAVDYQVGGCTDVQSNAAQLAHAQNIADAAEVDVQEVINVREGQCLGWGEIAHLFEVPPGTLGLGHSETHGGGKPDDAGKPDNVGKPDDTGKPDNTGKPDDIGKPDDAGKPDNPGRPDDVGKPDDAGKPENPGNGKPSE